jgi:hypothetical protein
MDDPALPAWWRGLSFSFTMSSTETCLLPYVAAIWGGRKKLDILVFLSLHPLCPYVESSLTPFLRPTRAGKTHSKPAKEMNSSVFFES